MEMVQIGILKEFQRIYDLLGVTFDSYNGEAYYNDKMEPIVDELADKGLLVESDGALVVELGEGMPPCLIMKSDGATLYATRDLAAAIDRKDRYDFVKSLYVVGNEQSLHFTQFKKVLRKMDYGWADAIQHIPFGLILKDGKKMSTRQGKIVLLEEVLNEAISLAQSNIEDKNPDLSDKTRSLKPSVSEQSFLVISNSIVNMISSLTLRQCSKQKEKPDLMFNMRMHELIRC